VSYDTICIEITTHCELRCIHCSASSAPERSDYMPFSTFEQVVDDLEPHREIYISGGEPFDHPELSRFVAFAAQRTRSVVVYSSGVVRDVVGVGPVARDYLRMLREAGLYRVDLSLYSAVAREHDDVTLRAGSFVTTLETIHRLTNTGVHVGAHFVPVVDHGARLADVSKLAHGLGVERLHVLALTKQGRGTHLDSSLHENFIRSIDSLSDGPHPEIVLSSAIRRELGISAPTARDEWRAGFVDVRGTLHPCEGKRLTGKSLLQARTVSDPTFLFPN
jgi:MoaA/NifB/PqqE/SkfB family radical SAM enzyme